MTFLHRNTAKQLRLTSRLTVLALVFLFQANLSCQEKWSDFGEATHNSKGNLVVVRASRYVMIANITRSPQLQIPADLDKKIRAKDLILVVLINGDGIPYRVGLPPQQAGETWADEFLKVVAVTMKDWRFKPTTLPSGEAVNIETALNFRKRSGRLELEKK